MRNKHIWRRLHKSSFGSICLKEDRGYRPVQDIRNFKSALKHLYFKEKVEFPAALQRAATGLSGTDLNFPCFPPHFDQSSGPILSLDQWKELVPGYSFYLAK